MSGWESCVEALGKAFREGPEIHRFRQDGKTSGIAQQKLRVLRMEYANELMAKYFSSLPQEKQALFNRRERDSLDIQHASLLASWPWGMQEILDSDYSSSSSL